MEAEALKLLLRNDKGFTLLAAGGGHTARLLGSRYFAISYSS